MNQDALTRRLLALLDSDARMSVSDLARALTRGRDQIEYRLKQFTTNEIIRSYTTVINPHLFGRSIYKVYLKAFQASAKRRAFMATLAKHPRVFWIAEADGRWNLMFSLVAKDPIEFFKLQNEILAPYRTVIRDLEVNPLIQGNFYSRQYLGAKPRTWSIGGEIKTHPLDEAGSKLLVALSRNARASNVYLGSQSGLRPDTLHHRLQNLEQAQVILGYRPEFNLSALGVTLFKAQLILDGFSTSMKEKFEQYCAAHERIVYLVHQIGMYPLEIEIEAADYYQYYRIIDEIQERFGEGIRSIDTSLIRQEWFKAVW